MGRGSMPELFPVPVRRLSDLPDPVLPDPVGVEKTEGTEVVFLAFTDSESSFLLLLGAGFRATTDCDSSSLDEDLVRLTSFFFFVGRRLERFLVLLVSFARLFLCLSFLGPPPAQRRRR